MYLLYLGVMVPVPSQVSMTVLRSVLFDEEHVHAWGNSNNNTEQEEKKASGKQMNVRKPKGGIVSLRGAARTGDG